LDNAAALCFGCHQRLDSQCLEKAEWFKSWIGKSAYEDLLKRANWSSKSKVDKKFIEIFLKKELQKYA
jgi:hypothetical protein